MLAHLKGKRRNFSDEGEEEDTEEGVDDGDTAPALATASRPHAMLHDDHTGVPADTSAMYADHEDTQMTCDVLVSLGNAAAHASPSGAATVDSTSDSSFTREKTNRGPRRAGGGGGLSSCPKSHQLPMFLSKTYHMIDRCEPSIATWSESGDNFVVKNVEKFASHVLPLYFKHSNFSSFARQLNFYGFRKLRTDPILTSDVDPRTACYVRFYHEKFQKNHPELLHEIKRATKSDQQSKDDVDSLKAEVSRLKECMGQLQNDTDRRLAEMSYESNRRITSLSAEYDKLTALVHQLLAAGAEATTHNNSQQQQLASGSLQQSNLLQNSRAATLAAIAAGVQPSSNGQSTSEQQQQYQHQHHQQTTAPSPSNMPDLMRSLSQVAALSLQRQAQEQAAAAAAAQQQNGGVKRSAEQEGDDRSASKKRQQE